MIQPQADRLRVEAEIARLIDDAVETIRDTLLDGDSVPRVVRNQFVADLLALCDESYDQGRSVTEHAALWRDHEDVLTGRKGAAQ